MFEWLNHNASAITATMQVLTWSCLIFSHYRLKWLIGRVHRLVSGKLLNSRDPAPMKETVDRE